MLGGIVASLFVVSSSTSTGSQRSDISEQVQESVGSLDAGTALAVLGIFLGALAVAGIFLLLFRILVCNPFEVGVARFFTRQSRSEEKITTKELLSGFTDGYGANVASLFLRDLFIALWSLLFVIPGIIKAFQWLLVPYIMADHPGMSGKEARDLSRSMMDGHKWAAFVLFLSFLGWHILSAFTFGILEVFYIVPYTEFTTAELYLTLKEEQ